MSSLRDIDPEISQAIALEAKRQKETINLIASENYASKAVLEAQGSFLTSKYAEGYPGARHYGGCENMDVIENLAIQRAKELFRADHVNVQPHSGAQANMAAYYAILEHGDTIMGLNLTHGGHLTHGDKATFSGKYFNSIPYGLNHETERIDYAELEKLAAIHKPKLIVTGASAYPRIIDFERFRFIADGVGAKLMVDIAHIAGLIAAGLHPSPVPYADIVTSTTHKTLRGTRGGFIMCRRELAAAIDKAVFPRLQGGPLMHSIAAKAVTFYEALQPEFVDYQQAVLDNARVLADELSKDGLRIVSDGTDNHIVLIDLAAKGISGPEAQDALQAAGIVANSNTVPFAATASRLHATGIRFGTPAVTTRGFRTEEIKNVAALIVKVLNNINDDEVRQAVHAEVIEIGKRFPVPGIDI
jgi:glycine hydroxymethyltransferase